jgi:hypothetical protein
MIPESLAEISMPQSRPRHLCSLYAISSIDLRERATGSSSSFKARPQRV